MIRYHRKVEESTHAITPTFKTLKYLSLVALVDFSLVAEFFFIQLSLVTLKKSSTCSSNFLNNFIKKAFVLMDVIQHTVQYPICGPLGCNAKPLKSQNRNSCKMCAYFWPWFVLCLADATIFFAQDRFMFFHNKVKNC